MQTTSQPQSTRAHGASPMVLTMIVGAILVATLLFAAVALVLGPVSSVAAEGDGAPVRSLTPTLLGFTGVVFLVNVVVWSVLRGRFERRLAARHREAEDELKRGVVPAELVTRTIVGAALGESIAILGAVIYLIEASRLALVPIVVGLLWVMLFVPSRERLAAQLASAGRTGKERGSVRSWGSQRS